jgi:ataxia telangiectasia mutated family protein
VKSLYPSALCLYGSWLAETRSENPSVIMDTYLERSVRLMEDLRERSEQEPRGATSVSAYLTLAR